jgi:uncharacterized protein YecE (DUF72 family)
VLPVALTQHPVVRWVGHPEAGVNEPWLDELAVLTAAWIEQGRVPYLMIHCPDTDTTPQIARRFAERLATAVGTPAAEIPGLAPFPVERTTESGGQLSLFEPGQPSSLS